MDLQSRNTPTIPDLTPEQAENTKLFLNLVADCMDTYGRCLIMRENILTRDTYKHKRNPKTGKLEAVIDDHGEKIISGHKGVNWAKPAIYEVAQHNDLLDTHEHCYSRKKVVEVEYWNEETHELDWRKEKRYIPPIRPSLLQTIIDSSATKKYLFVPVLVRLHPQIKTEETELGAEYKTINNYRTDDVCFGRCLWVDIDGHNLPIDVIKEQNPLAVARLLELLPDFCTKTGIPIPAVINSGRGVHLYWWLDEPLDLHDLDQQMEFRRILNSLNSWAGALIEHDDLCRSLWETDGSTAAIYHLMNLPGCVHPKTGQRRYVANRYGVDYHRYSYTAIKEAFETLVADTAAEPTVIVDQPVQLSLYDLPQHPVIQQESPHNTDAATSPTHVISTHPRYNPRMNKLLAWAESRNWVLFKRRRIFLLCMGIVFSCGAECDLTNPDVYPLHEINAMLADPLDHEEVDEVIASLAAKAKHSAPYKISDEIIATKLEMTSKEKNWYCAKGSTARLDYTPKTTFNDKFKEILATETFDPEYTCYPEFVHMCYKLTIKWFNENRYDKNRNSARTRRRKAKENYNPNGGRPSKYTDEDREKCRKFREQGLSYRKIAEKLGYSNSAVQRMLNDVNLYQNRTT